MFPLDLPFDAELVRNGQSACETARQATHELLILDQRPTAIMTGNNQMTIGALRALREAQVRVPEDMSLVGFDDIEWADVLSPRLTVMAQPVEELGARAVRLLTRRLENSAARRQTIRLTPSLLLRESVIAILM